MKILIDMNLSPEWVGVFEQNDIAAIHWSSVGDTRAADSEIMAWAGERSYIVFTHDLDFGTLLAAAGSRGPSPFRRYYGSNCAGASRHDTRENHECSTCHTQSEHVDII